MWDTKTTGKYLNLSTRTLERKRIDGTGPEFVKMGRAVRYLQSKVDAWVADHVATSTSDLRSQKQMPRDNMKVNRNLNGSDDSDEPAPAASS
ncbi:helix-turn-helix transcriptional regulator [Tardiphaga sp. 20_F10_N6_6]|uniref:helix-turn-helix transcriptional regulator n=1 Tax=Tardiphaga sp. 20_F10_N6_6 TaxID=3240788 RepID=UPI003F8AFE1A